MTAYAAFLGHQPNVSIAELAASVEGFKLIRVYGNSVLLFESSQELGQKHLDALGGTVLLARQASTSAKPRLEDVPGILTEETAGVKGKVTFALRAFGVAPARLAPLYRECKKTLTKKGKSSRYVGNERNPAATALLRDAGIASGKEGAEIIVLQEENALWIGRTVAAQDPDEYTNRDMGKPVRDTRVGLLPPKLAQVLLNLGAWAAKEAKGGKLPKQPLVFDPFCGTGVIPMEALVKGWHVLASDVSAKAVTGCEKNVEWIRKQKDIKKKEVTSRIWKQDATKKFDLKELPDMIVTEGTLGPALLKRPLAKDAQKLRAESDALELEFFKNAAACFPGAPIVMTFPFWHLKTGDIHLERVWKSFGDLGYEPVLPPGARSDDPARASIAYRRPDQFVGREIVILRPKAAR